METFVVNSLLYEMWCDVVWCADGEVSRAGIVEIRDGQIIARHCSNFHSTGLVNQNYITELIWEQLVIYM